MVAPTKVNGGSSKLRVRRLLAHRREIDKLRGQLDTSYGGGPAGLDTLAAALGEDPDTLEAVVEPFLLQLGFLQRTPRGRVLTDAGRAHLEAA